jgi:hypothetical protein
MTIRDDALSTFPPQPYGDVRPTVRTGDIFLCSGDDSFSRAIRAATKSPWSHVALALRLDDIDRVMVLESVAKLGVRTVPVSSFISQTSSGRKPFPGRILLARHSAFATSVQRPDIVRMADFAVDRFGAPFATKEIIKIGLRVAMGFFAVKMPAMLVSDDEFICSEYAERCYEQVGVRIPWDGLGFIAPSDFAAAPEVEALAQIQTG